MPTSTSTKKILSELLQEQQEPFKLEIYLHERGCKRKSFGCEGTFGCLFSSKRLSEGSTKKFVFYGRRAKRSNTSAVKICGRIAKDLCNRLVCINEILKLKDWNFGGGELNSVKGRRKKKEKEAAIIEEPGRLSFGSFSTEFDSFSESDLEDMIINSQIQSQSNNQNDEDAGDRMVQWRMMEDNKQCSPVSVLDEIEMISNEVKSNRQVVDSPSRLSFSFPNLKKATEECIFSATLWELFIHKRRNKREVVGTSKSSCSRHMNSKKQLQQTRQLLFDCVKEAAESQGSQRKAGHLIGAEDLGKIIREKIKSWDKNSVNGKKINNLLRLDLLSSSEEHDNLMGIREEIVKEVGDKILEDIKGEMTDEIVHLYFRKTQYFSGV